MAQRRKWQDGQVVGGWKILRCYTKKEPTQAHLVQCTGCGVKRRLGTQGLNHRPAGCPRCVHARRRKYEVEKGQVFGTQVVEEPWSARGCHLCRCLECGEFSMRESTELKYRCKSCAKLLTRG